MFYLVIEVALIPGKIWLARAGSVNIAKAVARPKKRA
jgi:hypothetical protein